MTRRLFPVPLLTLIAILTPAATAQPCPPATELAARILDGSADPGALPLTSVYGLDETLLAEQGRMRATVASRLEGPALRRLGELAADFCVALIVDAEGELMTVHQRRLELTELAAAEARKTLEAVVYNVRVDLPGEASEMLFLLRHQGSGMWGAAVIDPADAPLPPPSATAVRLPGSEEAWYEIVRRAPAVATPTAATGGTLLRVVPPRRQPVQGGTRFDVLVASEAVDKVVFELDGQKVAEDKRKPYLARLELASPPRVQTVRVIAFDSQGRELGDDTLVVNQLDVPFRVNVTELRPVDGGRAVEVTAEVTVPAAGRLDRVECYLNQELVERRERPPFRFRVPTTAVRPEDYVQVAAYLADGSSIDDVVLLASPVEEVAVNLVELHVVVTGPDDHPVGDLRPEEFTVLDRGVPRTIDTFAYADDVPLLAGVVIDTSGSMELVMHDTRRAAARFLGQTVLPQDRAFVVDFDVQPRLLQAVTGEMTQLMLSLGQLKAEGRTAMYDAIVFSMLQFEQARARKALVVLTDGDDLDSRYGPKQCVEMGQSLGVPIYVIGLGALDSLRRTYSKSDLRKVTAETGGRLYFVNSIEELGAAYAVINAELRSQYSLSFYTDRDLSPEERRAVEVRLARPGLTARIVVGAGRTPP